MGTMWRAFLNRSLTAGIAFLLSASFLASQNTTRNYGEPSAGTTNTKPKILLVPFENKLYLSEIDFHINKASGWNFKKIRHFFRSEIDKAVQQQFARSYAPVSLMKDTARHAKDIQYIHNSIGYSYDPVPGEKPEGKDTRNSLRPKVKEGELVVETDPTKRFMNTVVAAKGMYPYIDKKFGASYILFINQLDLRNASEGSYDLATNTYQRIAAVHYAIRDIKGNKIYAGLVACSFSSSQNDPKKIVGECFPVMAKKIYDDFILALNPPPLSDKK